ncbi:hypothetical protein BpHYR1_003916 [Brachionus plicatilis]|uniref:Uncharacterized protein n=1 Tax=Brachionus plicatilis TaxID=10195 RepID=A0A3M7REK6_BRAPC|nr:hypothetical protein BpHYR1_003916 [Brachionus plicatilis]
MAVHSGDFVRGQKKIWAASMIVCTVPNSNIKLTKYLYMQNNYLDKNEKKTLSILLEEIFYKKMTGKIFKKEISKQIGHSSMSSIDQKLNHAIKNFRIPIEETCCYSIKEESNDFYIMSYEEKKSRIFYSPKTILKVLSTVKIKTNLYAFCSSTFLKLFLSSTLSFLQLFLKEKWERKIADSFYAFLNPVGSTTSAAAAKVGLPRLRFFLNGLLTEAIGIWQSPIFNF